MPTCTRTLSAQIFLPTMTLHFYIKHTKPNLYQCFGSGLIDSGSGSSILGWIPIRIQAFDDQNLEKMFSWKKLIFFWSQPSKENILTSKHEISQLFPILWVIFAFLDPGLIRIRIWNTDLYESFEYEVTQNVKFTEFCYLSSSGSKSTSWKMKQSHS